MQSIAIEKNQVKNYDNIQYFSTSCCEEINFVIDYFNYQEIAHKALLLSFIKSINTLCINDKIFSLLSIKLKPTLSKADLKAIVRGLESTAKVLNIHIIGGDTIVGDDLEFHFVFFTSYQASKINFSDYYCEYFNKIAYQEDLDYFHKVRLPLTLSTAYKKALVSFDDNFKDQKLSHKEDFFISCFHYQDIGDDGVVLGDLIYAMDSFCQDVHFKIEWFSYEEIATKALLINISDMLAMNANINLALVILSHDNHLGEKNLAKLKQALEKTTLQYGIKTLEIQTQIGKKLDFHILLSGTKNKKVLTRKGIKPKDLLAFTGNLGTCKKDLEKLLSKRPINANSKFKKPLLKEKFIYKVSYFLSAGLDISDGLFKELDRLSRLNLVNFNFLYPLTKLEKYSGEEYELLFAFSFRQRLKVLRLSQITRTKINIFAQAKRGKFKARIKAQHF